jgi:hypothetical protein
VGFLHRDDCRKKAKYDEGIELVKRTHDGMRGGGSPGVGLGLPGRPIPGRDGTEGGGGGATLLDRDGRGDGGCSEKSSG